MFSRYYASFFFVPFFNLQCSLEFGGNNHHTGWSNSTSSEEEEEHEIMRERRENHFGTTNANQNATALAVRHELVTAVSEGKSFLQRGEEKKRCVCVMMMGSIGVRLIFFDFFFDFFCRTHEIIL
jgi:hypothetical protein